MAQEGFVLKVNGKVVFETDENVIEASLRSEQGEIARFGALDPHVIEFEYRTESAFNRHLNSVEREQQENRREAVREENERRSDTSSETETEVETETETENTDTSETQGNETTDTFDFGSTDGETNTEDEGL